MFSGQRKQERYLNKKQQRKDKNRLTKQQISPNLNKNMRTQSRDTNIKTERFLISLLQKEKPEKKFSRIRSLSETAINLSKRAIKRANKNLNEEQINLLFIEYNYGKDLAAKVQKYLNKTQK